MPNREKVIKGLKQCFMPRDIVEYETQCEGCPYFDPDVSVDECRKPLLDDTLALLKEYEKQISRRDEIIASARSEISRLEKEQEGIYDSYRDYCPNDC